IAAALARFAFAWIMDAPPDRSWKRLLVATVSPVMSSSSLRAARDREGALIAGAAAAVGVLRADEPGGLAGRAGVAGAAGSAAALAAGRAVRAVGTAGGADRPDERIGVDAAQVGRRRGVEGVVEAAHEAELLHERIHVGTAADRVAARI